MEVEIDEPRLLRTDGEAGTTHIETGRRIPGIRTGPSTRGHAGLEARHVLYEALEKELDSARGWREVRRDEQQPRPGGGVKHTCLRVEARAPRGIGTGRRRRGLQGRRRSLSVP